MNLWRFTENVKVNHTFLTIDTTLPASDLLRFRRNLLIPL